MFTIEANRGFDMISHVLDSPNQDLFLAAQSIIQRYAESEEEEIEIIGGCDSASLLKLNQ